LAIYHIPDINAIPGPRFFSLVNRLPAYQGVLRMRVEAENEDNEEVGNVIPGDNYRTIEMVTNSKLFD
jgi:hypothetical protein